WLTASCGLAHSKEFPGPQLLLMPELKHSLEKKLDYVNEYIKKDRFCAIAISEGYQPNITTQSKDAFGHHQLEGSGSALAELIKKELNVKVHLSIPDYLQRSFTPCLSKTDFDQAQAIGHYSIYCIKHNIGHNTMISIVRLHDDPYLWSLDHTPLNKVANQEKAVPRSFLDKTGFALSEIGLNYFKPLIAGNVAIPQDSNYFEKFWTHLLQKKNEFIDHSFQ
ncbi:diphosphate--fructose-6-phosphate 1-phosphotransferase, partial [bacterium]|nr:diphosphate--fructose-6-phosphate 1-phosphotransferase [bacterium]